MGIGSTLQQLLELQNSNVNEVATATGVSASTLYSIIRRDSMSANIEDLYKVAHYLGVSLDYFYETKNLPFPTLDFSPEEKELFHKYQSLDKFSQETIAWLINREYQRLKSRRDSKCIDFASAASFRVSDQPASAGTGIYLGPDGFTEKLVNAEDVAGADFGVPVRGDSMEPKYHDGDTLLISMSQSVEVGDVALVTMDGCGYVKKIGHGELISLNQKYKPIPMTEDIRINGKVIGVLPAEK